MDNIINIVLIITGIIITVVQFVKGNKMKWISLAADIVFIAFLIYDMVCGL